MASNKLSLWECRPHTQHCKLIILKNFFLICGLTYTHKSSLNLFVRKSLLRKTLALIIGLRFLWWLSGKESA